MIQYLFSYHHTHIALRRASRIVLSRRLFLVAGLAPFAVPRDAVVDYRTNVERLKDARRERLLRRKSTPLIMTSASCRRK